MKVKSLVIVSAAAILLFGAACAKKASIDENANVNNGFTISNNNSDDNANSAVDENSNSNVNKDAQGNTNGSEDTNVNDNSNGNTNSNENSNVNDNEHSVASGTLTVSKPESGDKVESPLEVEGTSSATIIYVRVKNANGTTIFTVPVTVRNGEFKSTPTFSFTNTTSGTVEVFAKDEAGNEIDLVSIPVTFKIETSSNGNDNTNTNSNANTNENINANANANSDSNVNLGY